MGGGVTIRIPSQIADIVKNIATTEGKSQSQIVREAIAFKICTDAETIKFCGKIYKSGRVSCAITVPQDVIKAHELRPGDEIWASLSKNTMRR